MPSSPWHSHPRPLISRSVQIYYCIDPIPFPPPTFSFCSPGVSSFYIWAASAKQLMCTECVDSNCLAIVAPSRSRPVPVPPSLERVALDHRAACTDPAAFFRSILLPFRDKSALPSRSKPSPRWIGVLRSSNQPCDRCSHCCTFIYIWNNFNNPDGVSD